LILRNQSELKQRIKPKRLSIIPSNIIRFNHCSSKVIRLEWSWNKVSRYLNLVNTFLIQSSPGVSAGAYAALISWIRGYQYTPVSEGESHHQIMTHSHSSGPRTGFNHTSWFGDPSHPGKTALESTRYQAIVLGSTVCPVSDLRGVVYPVGVGSLPKGEMKETQSPRPRWKEIVTFDDYLPNETRSKGDQETFRRGALVRAETPKKGKKEKRFAKWYARRSYQVHPYWTTNLKYV